MDIIKLFISEEYKKFDEKINDCLSKQINEYKKIIPIIDIGK